MTPRAPITDPAAALAFVTAGKAVFSVRSRRTGLHLTFKVKAAKTPGLASHFVSLRSNGEAGAYAYLGMVDPAGFRTTRKGTFAADSQPARAFRYVLDHLRAGRMPPDAELWHEGCCGRCGRALTVPASIASGLGPECAGKTRRASAA